MPRPSVRLTLSTRSARSLAANFQSRDKALQREARATVRDVSEALWSDAFADCPKDTWHMATSLRHRVSPDGLAYEVGWDEADFPAAFYPVFVIFGTRFQAPNDFFFPLRDEADRELRRRLSAALRASIARGRGR